MLARRRPRIASSLLVVFVALLAVVALPQAASARSSAACANAGSVPAAHNGTAIRRATLCLLNRERARHGLGRLRSNGRLRAAALRHSGHMARANFFDHTSPSGSSMTDRVRRAGYLRGSGGWALGENIAWGAGSLATPRAIVRAWMRSPGHRANILTPRFREIGVGVAHGAPVRIAASVGGATYTTDFGARR